MYAPHSFSTLICVFCVNVNYLLKGNVNINYSLEIEFSVIFIFVTNVMKKNYGSTFFEMQYIYKKKLDCVPHFQ